MKKMLIKIENGELKIHTDTRVMGIDWGNQEEDSYSVIESKEDAPIFRNPTLEQLSVLGIAFKKAHEKILNKMKADIEKITEKFIESNSQ